MPDTGWTDVMALAAAYLIAVVTTPAGISGAVLLLPFQVTVLATPSPSGSPWGSGAWPAGIPVPASNPGCLIC